MSKLTLGDPDSLPFTKGGVQAEARPGSYSLPAPCLPPPRDAGKMREIRVLARRAGVQGEQA